MELTTQKELQGWTSTRRTGVSRYVKRADKFLNFLEFKSLVLDILFHPRGSNPFLVF